LLNTSDAEFRVILKSRLSSSFGVRVYSTIVSLVDFTNMNDGVFSFEAKSQTALNALKTLHYDKFCRILRQTALDVFLVNPKNIAISLASQTTRGAVASSSANNYSAGKNPYGQLSIQINDAKYNFDSFICVKENSMAINMCKDFAKSIIGQGEMGLEKNLLFINGSVGNGKTHLLQSIASIAMRGGKNITYLTADKFSFQYIKAVKDNKLIDFKEQLFASDVLFVDDIHFICGKKGSTEELYNIINAMLNDGKPVALSSVNSINALKFVNQSAEEEDRKTFSQRFKSTLHAGISCCITNPSGELRKLIIKQKAIEYAIILPEDVVNFLTLNVTTSIRDIESSISKIKTHFKYASCKIDLNFVRQILQEFLDNFKKSIEPSDVVAVVAKVFNISVSDFTQGRSNGDLTIARNICMCLLKDFTTLSYTDIANIFGKKTHTVVVNAITSFEKLKMNPNFCDIISNICSIIKDGSYLSS